MQQLADWYFAFVFFVIVLGFLVAGILFFVNKTDSFSSRLLAGFLTTISIVALNNELMATTFFLRYPHLWRVVVAASFCVPPLGYLYVRSVLEQSYRFRRTDFLFFLPAILYTLTLLPFYMLPAADKLNIIKKVIANNGLIAQEPESILPKGWGIMARVFFGAATTIAQFILLARWKKRILLSKEGVKQNENMIRWLFLFTVLMFSFYILLIIMFAFQLTVYFSIWQLFIFTITATILFICLYLLFRPSILYGITGWINQPKPQQVAAPGDEEIVPYQQTADHKKVTLTIEQGKAFKEMIENHFKASQPYLKGGYTMSDLSKELNIPSHQLSAFINQDYGKNFNELINEYRVDYLDTLLKTSPENFQYTLEALGKLAGFNSRAAFITAVKKKTGLTPSDFFGKRSEKIPA